MSILGGIGLIVLGATIGVIAPAFFSANDEKCPYQDTCPRFERYKCNYIRGKNNPERED